MRITKYAQSTFTFEYSNGTRVLVDPGKYNPDNGVTAADFGALDLVIITHEREDHFDLDFTKQVLSHSAPAIIASAKVHEVLKAAGIASKLGAAGEIRMHHRTRPHRPHGTRRSYRQLRLRTI